MCFDVQADGKTYTAVIDSANVAYHKGSAFHFRCVYGTHVLWPSCRECVVAHLGHRVSLIWAATATSTWLYPVIHVTCIASFKGALLAFRCEATAWCY